MNSINIDFWRKHAWTSEYPRKEEIERQTHQFELEQWYPEISSLEVHPEVNALTVNPQGEEHVPVSR